MSHRSPQDGGSIIYKIKKPQFRGHHTSLLTAINRISSIWTWQELRESLPQALPNVETVGSRPFSNMYVLVYVHKPDLNGKGIWRQSDSLKAPSSAGGNKKLGD